MGSTLKCFHNTAIKTSSSTSELCMPQGSLVCTSTNHADCPTGDLTTGEWTMQDFPVCTEQRISSPCFKTMEVSDCQTGDLTTGQWTVQVLPACTKQHAGRIPGLCSHKPCQLPGRISNNRLADYARFPVCTKHADSLIILRGLLRVAREPNLVVRVRLGYTMARFGTLATPSSYLTIWQSNFYKYPLPSPTYTYNLTAPPKLSPITVLNGSLTMSTTKTDNLT